MFFFLIIRLKVIFYGILVLEGLVRSRGWAFWEYDLGKGGFYCSRVFITVFWWVVFSGLRFFSFLRMGGVKFFLSLFVSFSEFFVFLSLLGSSVSFFRSSS